MILNSRGTVEPPQYRWNTMFDNYTWTTDDNVILQDTTSTYSRPTEYQLLQECVKLLKDIITILSPVNSAVLYYDNKKKSWKSIKKKKKKGRKK